jgi:hypothetical protein
METTPVSTSSRTLKVRASKSVDTTPSNAVKVVTVKRKPKAITKPSVSATADFTDMIATAAYFIAQQRNFAPGNELSDWLMAEQQVLASQAKK